MLLLMIFCSQVWGREPSIRVRISKSLSEVVVSGMDLSRTVHRSGELRTHEGEKAIRFDCGRLKKTAAKIRPDLLASVSSPTGFVTVNKERYRGSILLTISSEGGKGCDVINKTTMEYYIGGLLAKEMNASWPLEALKSQAIAARTYAFYMMRSRRVDREKGVPLHYDLESSERHQVGGSLDDITRRTDRAARATGGYVLEGPDFVLTPAFYHAKCGGQTFSPRHIWEYPVSGYSSVVCGGCKGRGGRSQWDHRIGRERWKGFVAWLWKKKLIRGERSLLSETVQLAPDKPSRYTLRLYMGERAFILKKSLLRRYFGRVKVPSNYFRARWDERSKEVVLSGDGLGHGVGLCQIGALGLADRGWSFRQILGHYFPSHRVTKIY